MRGFRISAICENIRSLLEQSERKIARKLSDAEESDIEDMLDGLSKLQRALSNDSDPLAREALSTINDLDRSLQNSLSTGVVENPKRDALDLRSLLVLLKEMGRNDLERDLKRMLR